MKQRGPKGTVHAAMVPGTLCGMIPPAIGWAAVDNARLPWQTRSGLYILMIGLGVWQFPHFLLVFLKENRLDEGNPCTGGVMVCRGNAGSRWWPGRLCSALSMMLFALKGGIVSGVLSGFLLVSLALFLPLFLSFLLWKARPRSLDLGFRALNLAMLAYMALILSGPGLIANCPYPGLFLGENPRALVSPAPLAFLKECACWPHSRRPL